MTNTPGIIIFTDLDIRQDDSTSLGDTYKTDTTGRIKYTKTSDEEIISSAILNGTFETDDSSIIKPSITVVDSTKVEFTGGEIDPEGGNVRITNAQPLFLTQASVVTTPGTAPDMPNPALQIDAPDAKIYNFGTIKGSSLFGSETIPTNTEGAKYTNNAIAYTDNGTGIILSITGGITSSYRTADEESDYKQVIGVSSGHEGGYAVTIDALGSRVTELEAMEYNLDFKGQGTFLLANAGEYRHLTIADATTSHETTDTSGNPVIVNSLSAYHEITGDEIKGFIIEGSDTSESVDLLDGSNKSDWILGKNGTDNISGFQGDDYISGDDGDDDLSGDEGNDFLFGDDGNDIIEGGDDHDTLFGGDGDDTLFGDNDPSYTPPPGSKSSTKHSGNDIIDGGNGNDYIVGGKGDDTLIGGNGNDTLLGGHGIDYIDGGNGDDTIEGNGRGDEIHAGDGNDHVKAGSGDDTVNGGDGNDYIHGQSGNDTIEGGEGNDRLFGGGGEDTVLGGNGNDYVVGHSGNDTVSGGSGNDSVKGGKGNDTLFGDEGDDNIMGGTGDDIINGGLGSDRLDGGPGSNMFIFSSIFDSTSEEKDTIVRFNDGFDKIDVTKLADSGIVNFDDLVIEQTGKNHVTISAENHDVDFQLDVTGVTSLDESDFIFA